MPLDTLAHGRLTYFAALLPYANTEGEFLDFVDECREALRLLAGEPEEEPAERPSPVACPCRHLARDPQTDGPAETWATTHHPRCEHARCRPAYGAAHCACPPPPRTGDHEEGCPLWLAALAEVERIAREVGEFTETDAQFEARLDAEAASAALRADIAAAGGEAAWARGRRG